jgi:lysophospholipase L1-like esterase
MSRFGAVSILSLGLVVAAVVAPVSASPGATPNGSAGGSYVALGDSFTAGQGAWPGNLSCLRSASSSYPAIAAATSSYREAVNVACSGATLGDVVLQVGSIDARTKLKASLVTITIGGIDARSSQVFQVCASVPEDCAAALNAAVADLEQVVVPLRDTYRFVAAEFPKARIVVLTYPLLFDPNLPTTLQNPGLGPLVSGVNAATGALNAAIREAVVSTGNSRVSLIDVTTRFAAHGIGSTNQFITGDLTNPETLISNPASFHPNAAGNAAYAEALRAAGFLRGR